MSTAFERPIFFWIFTNVHENSSPELAQEEEAANEEPEENPLAEIADELERILEVEQNKFAKLESKFNLGDENATQEE